MKYIIDGRFNLVIDTYNYFIIHRRKWTYSFIYYSIAYDISFYQPN